MRGRGEDISKERMRLEVLLLANDWINGQFQDIVPL